MTTDHITFDRSWDLEECVIRSGGDGRTVEAYAAVFDTPAEITDQHGHYIETVDSKAFNRTLSHGIERFRVFYNHSMTMYGTPSELGSVPIGRPLDVKADKRGLLTVTRYNKSELADAVLEAIRNGDITGYSFRGPILQANPRRPPRARPGRPLPTWRLLELGLKEFGPTPVPSYAGAGIVAVRSATQLAAALDEAKQLIMSSSTPQDPDDETATPDTGPGTEDSPDGHSGRQKMLRLRSEIRARGV
jgi:HK97 family phage prohead protease